MFRTRVGAALVAAALWACDGDEGAGPPTDPMLAAVQGSWGRCVTEGPNDQRHVLAIVGTSVTGTVTIYEGMDATCASTVVTTVPLTQTFTLGGTVNVPLGVGTVPAREIDVVQSSPPQPNIYSIAYVLTAAEPDLLYDGDTDVDPDYGGTSPASRPRVLDEAHPYVRVP